MLTCEIAESEQGAKNFKTKILIATQKSQFKKAVVSEVSKSLEKEGYVVKVINLKELSSVAVYDYQAIIIVNTCWVWQINSHAKKFLKKLSKNEKKKIILFTTAKNENWEPKIAGVDAVTSASRINKANVISKAIMEKLQILLASKKEK